jgi:signal transduction histidine kinase
MSIQDNPTLPALTGRLEIDFAGLNLSTPERVRCRYELEGTDKGWQDAGTRREAFYTNLSPGKHRFRMNARNVGGEWNKEDTVLEFSVAPAWFQTYWFFALCAALASLIVWALYRIRVRQIAQAMSVRFDERLAERTRIARDLHDTLLQTIQGSKLVADSALRRSADPSPMRGSMEQLSVWLGRATDEGRAALNSLRTSTIETNDLAEAFRRSIEECRIHSSMEASFFVVGQVSEMHPIVRDEVYRIGYEAIRNACAHSQATQLQVELTYAEDLILRIRDNGVGINHVIVDEGKEGHFGLQGMRERALRIMAKLTVESSADTGTEIKLVVPGSIIYRKEISGRRKIPSIKAQLKRMGLTSDSTGR